jgi:hypothetical protein
MLEKIVTATARPLPAATGATGVLIALFGLMQAFNLGISAEQQAAIVVFVAVVGNYLIAVTGNAMLRKILGDPEVPTVDGTVNPSGTLRPAQQVPPVDPDTPSPWKV